MRFRLWLILMAMLLGASAYATDIVLQQGVDGYTGGTDRAIMAHYGATPVTLFNLRYSGISKRGYLLRFDVSAIPEGATITSATLKLYSLYAYTGGKNVSCLRITDVDSLGGSWTEGWNATTPGGYRDGATPRYRNHSSTPWESADTGDEDTNTLINSTATAGVGSTAAYASSSWNSHTVTAYVQAWVDGAVNQGMYLYGEDDSNIQEVRGNGYTVDTAYRPKLEISYTAGTPLNVPTLSTPTDANTDQALTVDLAISDTNTSPNETGIIFRIKEGSGAYHYSSTQAADTTSINAAVVLGYTPLNATIYYWSAKAVGNGTTTSDSAYPTDFSFTTVAGEAVDNRNLMMLKVGR